MLEVLTEVSRGPEFPDYHAALQAAADPLDFAGQLRILRGAAQGIVEDADQVADIIADIVGVGRAPVVHVDELDQE